MMSPQQHRPILLVDGHNYLFRYFRGMPRTIFSSEGQLIHGAYGFIAAVLKQVKRFDSRTVIVSFDSQTPTTRSDLVSSYKANRVQAFEPGSDNNPFTQLDCVTSVLEYLGITSIEIPGVEADDIIGSLSACALSACTSVIIATGDKDCLQLVSDSVSVCDRRGSTETLYTPKTVHAKFGVLPCQYVDFRALTGDSSDNVKGVPGIGPKTAADLLNRFNSIDSLFANLRELKPRLAQLLESHRETILLNKEVLKINTTIPVDTTLLDQENSSAAMELSAKQAFTKAGFFKRTEESPQMLF